MEERLSLRRRIALDITKKLRDDVTRSHPLQQLFWECTLRCNHHCRHCGSDCKQTTLVPDMPMEVFARVLDSVAAAMDPHGVMIDVTGGEPLMRPDDVRERISLGHGDEWIRAYAAALSTAA